MKCQQSWELYTYVGQTKTTKVNFAHNKFWKSIPINVYKSFPFLAFIFKTKKHAIYARI